MCKDIPITILNQEDIDLSNDQLPLPPANPTKAIPITNK